MKRKRDFWRTAGSIFPCVSVFQPRPAEQQDCTLPTAIPRLEGFPPHSWRGATLWSFSFTSRPLQCVPAWVWYASFKWIYGPINGESLCIIKSRTDLTGVQFNNYLSNSIIFRYVVSVSADLEDLLGALGKQHFFTAQLLKPFFLGCTQLRHVSKLRKQFVQLWSVCVNLDVKKDAQRPCTCTFPSLEPSPLVS